MIHNNRYVLEHTDQFKIELKQAKVLRHRDGNIEKTPQNHVKGYDSMYALI